MPGPYSFLSEKDHNKALAEAINRYWAEKGRDAGARPSPLMVGGGDRKSRKYFTVVSRMKNGFPVGQSWAG